MRKLLSACILGCVALSPLQSVEEGASTPQRIECKKIDHKKKALNEQQNEFLDKSPAPIEQFYHPIYYIKDIGAKGKTLTTYDESVWTISDRGARVASKWKPESPVIIALNKSFFSSYTYLLKNLSTQESAPANLALGPFVENAIFIVSFHNNVITLSNGSEWTIGFWNRLGAFKKWKIGQAVLIGETGSQRSPCYILINVNENNYVSVDLQK
jgi:hypothetical protein